MQFKINYIFIDPDYTDSEYLEKLMKDMKNNCINIVKNKTWSSFNWLYYLSVLESVAEEPIQDHYVDFA